MCANRCLVWGITDEQKNVDTWDVERRTELTVPSAAIVHIEKKNGGEPGTSTKTRC